MPKNSKENQKTLAECEIISEISETKVISIEKSYECHNGKIEEKIKEWNGQKLFTSRYVNKWIKFPNELKNSSKRRRG